MQKKIGERIRLLREERNIIQEEVAKALNVTRETIARWENGTRDIKTDATMALAKFFNVTSDYLLGLSDYKTFENTDIGETTGLSEEVIKSLKGRLEHYKELYDNEPEYKDFINEQIEFEMDALNALIQSIIKDDLPSKMFWCRSQIFYMPEKSENGSGVAETLGAYSERNAFMEVMECTFDKCTGYNKNKVNDFLNEYFRQRKREKMFR